MREYSFETLSSPVPVDPLDARSALLTAGAERDAIREQARTEGFAAGRAEALTALAPASAALAAAAEQLRTGAAEAADALEAQAVELALSIAEKVLAGALAADPSLVLEAIRGALRGIVDRSRVTVLVHPDDLELVRAAAPELASTLGGIDALEVQGERRVAAGGAVVRHAEGEVDATVATKLERVRELVAAT